MSYTLSHSIDNQSEPLFGDYFNLTFTRSASPISSRQSTFTQAVRQRADRGNSDFRPETWPHVLWTLGNTQCLVATHAIPDPRLEGRLLGAIRSGLPYTVTTASIAGSSLLSNRASLVVPASDAMVNQPTRRCATVEPLCISANGTASIGNIGRNAFRGPGFFGLDLSLSRNFAIPRLGESGRLTVRADAYNVMNHANLGNPDAFVGSPTFGLATYGRQEATTGFPALAPLRETARQIQLLFRIEF